MRAPFARTVQELSNTLVCLVLATLAPEIIVEFLRKFLLFWKTLNFVISDVSMLPFILSKELVASYLSLIPLVSTLRGSREAGGGGGGGYSLPRRF